MRPRWCWWDRWSFYICPLHTTHDVFIRLESWKLDQDYVVLNVLDKTCTHWTVSYSDTLLSIVGVGINHVPSYSNSENKAECCSGAPSKLKKAFQGPKMSVSSRERLFQGYNGSISNCVQLLYLGLWPHIEPWTRWSARELNALPRSPSWWWEGLLHFHQELQRAFGLCICIRNCHMSITLKSVDDTSKLTRA